MAMLLVALIVAMALGPSTEVPRFGASTAWLTVVAAATSVE
jgi:hypothetical protein